MLYDEPAQYETYDRQKRERWALASVRERAGFLVRSGEESNRGQMHMVCNRFQGACFCFAKTNFGSRFGDSEGRQRMNEHLASSSMLNTCTENRVIGGGPWRVAVSTSVVWEVSCS